MQRHVLHHQREAEAHALAAGAATPAPPREAVEHQVALVGQHAGAGILDRDGHVVLAVDGHRGRTRCVLLGVVEQVGDHPDHAGALSARITRSVERRRETSTGTSAPVAVAPTAWRTSSAEVHLVERRSGPRRRRTGRSRAGRRPACWKQADVGLTIRSTTDSGPESSGHRRGLVGRAPATDAARVISGRAQLVADVRHRRPSRSTRSSRAWAMWLKDDTSTCRVGVVARRPGVEPAPGESGLGGETWPAAATCPPAGPVGEGGTRDDRDQGGRAQRAFNDSSVRCSWLSGTTSKYRACCSRHRDADGQQASRRS